MPIKSLLIDIGSAAIESEPSVRSSHRGRRAFQIDGEQDGDPVAYKVFASIVKYIFSKIDKEKDILGRYGQNGLSVLMPKVDMNAAEKFAEMTRQAVQSARYKTAYGEKSATLSIGVAAITDDTGDYSSMVKRADMASICRQEKWPKLCQGSSIARIDRGL